MTKQDQISLGRAIMENKWHDVVGFLKNDGYSLDAIYVTLKKHGLTREDVEYYAT